MNQVATIDRAFQGSTIRTNIPLNVLSFSEFVQESVGAIAESGGIVLDGIGKLANIFAQADSQQVFVDWEGIPRSASQFIGSVPPIIREIAITPIMTNYDPVDNTIEELANSDRNPVPFDVKIGVAKLTVMFFVDQISDMVFDEVNNVVTQIKGGANPANFVNSIPHVTFNGITDDAFIFSVNPDFFTFSMARNPFYMPASPPAEDDSEMETSSQSSENSEHPMWEMAQNLQSIENISVTSEIDLGPDFYKFLADMKRYLLENASEMDFELETVDDVIRASKELDDDIPGVEIFDIIPESVIGSITDYENDLDHNAREASALAKTYHFNPPQVNLESYSTRIGDQAKIGISLLALRSWAYIVAEKKARSIEKAIIESITPENIEARIRETSNDPVSLQLVNFALGEVAFIIKSDFYEYEGAGMLANDSSDESSTSSSDEEIPDELMPRPESDIIPLNEDVKDPLDPESPPFDLSTVTTFPTLEDLIRTMRAMPGDTPINILERFPPCDYTDTDPIMAEPYANSEKGSFVVFMIPTGGGSYKASCISISAFPIPAEIDPETGRMEDSPRNVNYFANWVLKYRNTNIDHGNGNGGRPGTRRFSKIPIPYNLYFESNVFNYIKTRSESSISRDLLPIFWLQALPAIRMGRASNREGNPFIGQLHGQDPLENPYGIVAYGELPFANMPDPE